jgi:hypothetical protein
VSKVSGSLMILRSGWAEPTKYMQQRNKEGKMALVLFNFKVKS